MQTLQGSTENADWIRDIRLNFFHPLEELHQPFMFSPNLIQGQANSRELLHFVLQHTTESTSFYKPNVEEK